MSDLYKWEDGGGLSMFLQSNHLRAIANFFCRASL